MFDLFGMIREKRVIMISKELLSEVINIKIEDIIDLKMFGKDLKYYEKCLLKFCYDGRLSKHKDSICKSINIYELAHKCKEWAYNKGYEIVSLAHMIRIYKNGYEVYYTNSTLFDLDMFFKACQWILDNKEDI